MTNLPNELYGIRCECGEHDRSKFYFYESKTPRMIECLTCNAKYQKTRNGYYYRVNNATT